MSDEPSASHVEPDTSPELRRLVALLGSAPPRSVAQLPAESLHELAERIEAGRRHHAAATDRATEDGLRSMPLPMRAVVKKTLR